MVGRREGIDSTDFLRVVFATDGTDFTERESGDWRLLSCVESVWPKNYAGFSPALETWRTRRATN
jgi:hypothetical protein